MFNINTLVQNDPAAAELLKSLSVGYATDHASFSGGQVLSRESLDRVYHTALAGEDDAVFFKIANKSAAANSIDEWVLHSGNGSFIGQTINGGAGTDVTSSVVRGVGKCSPFFSYRSYDALLDAANNVVSPRELEALGGASAIFQDFENCAFNGNSSITPYEFDGIKKIVSANASNVINMAATPISSLSTINNAAYIVRSNFGRANAMFSPLSVQNDIDTALDGAVRIMSNNDAAFGGSAIQGYKTSYGLVNSYGSPLLTSSNAPFETAFSAVAAANAFVPASVTGTAAADAASEFTTGWDGNYYYAVAGINEKGQSVVVKSAQKAIGVGEKMTLTITASVAGNETGYVIYRSKKGGTNTTADFREIGRVAKAGATTTFVDYNASIPGTECAYVLDMSAADVRLFQPLSDFPLASTNAVRYVFALYMSGYARVTAPKKHVVIKNILPSSAVWNPKG